jgi:Tol biopolymer transport system component/DNA-binding winged helix-turn-helix (wHTH) protein
MASRVVRMSDNVQDRVRFGPFEADLHTHELWKGGIRIRLLGQPFEILALLLSKPSQLVTREELRARLWPGDTFVDFNHGLNAAMNKLRDALCDSAEDPKYIETLPRRGYRFIALVDRATDRADVRDEGAKTAEINLQKLPAVQTQSGEVELETVPSLESAIAKENTGASPNRSFRLVVLTAAVLLVILFAFVTWIFSSHKPSETRVGRRPSMPSAPLTDLADRTSDPAFSPDGTRVAFRRHGYGAGNSGIYVKTIGSPQLLQLTNNPADCCPAWMPNGRAIAFSRFTDKEHEIYAVAAGGGGLRKLYATAIGPKHGELDWSPDGNSVAFVGQSSQGTSSIFVLSKDLTARRITGPVSLDRDWGPAFSPDGQSLAFVRTRESGLPENILVMPVGGGESRVVVTFYNGILGPPAWTVDGQSLVFASGGGLLRAPVFGADQITTISDAGSPVRHPAIARNGYHLAYQKVSQAISTWELDVIAPQKTNSHPLIVTESGRNEGAQLSPDGKKLAVMSNRSGSMELWVSDRDGSNPYQVTAMGGVGTPHWSPNGRSIAFDVGWRDRGAVFVVDLPGGLPRPLAQDSSDNLVPNWSRDGKWVYFASTRTGMWQVWRAPVQGGPAVQVTTHGGFAAFPSQDGNTLYYSKSNLPDPEVWQVPMHGGIETRVPQVQPADWACWAPIGKGIFFVEKSSTEHSNVMFFDFATSDVHKVSGLDKLPFWLSSSPDGKSLFYEHLDQENSHIMLLSNFQ